MPTDIVARYSLIKNNLTHIIARRLLMLGEPLDVEAARELGLIDVIVEQYELSETAEALAYRLASGSTLAYGRIKSLLMSSSLNILPEQLDA